MDEKEMVEVGGYPIPIQLGLGFRVYSHPIPQILFSLPSFGASVPSLSATMLMVIQKDQKPLQ